MMERCVLASLVVIEQDCGVVRCWEMERMGAGDGAYLTGRPD